MNLAILAARALATGNKVNDGFLVPLPSVRK